MCTKNLERWRICKNRRVYFRSWYQMLQHLDWSNQPIHLQSNTVRPTFTSSLFYKDRQTGRFQLDGAAVHTEKSISRWFTESNITVIQWCARSPNHNPIENIWSWIGRKVVTTHNTSVKDLQKKF